MKTGKALGFKKGDFVMTPLSPGIIIGQVHTTAPLCEVWGVEQEMGSAYAEELVKITGAEFLALVGRDIRAYDKTAQGAINGLVAVHG